jgi:hypothetical protein
MRIAFSGKRKMEILVTLKLAREEKQVKGRDPLPAFSLIKTMKIQSL